MEPNFLLVNKPIDWTSHDVVGFLRNRIRKSACLPERQGLSEIRKLKIGHAGTLDPFATGLLIVGVGREATKRLDEFKNMKKEYVATIKLGATSNTDDCTGVITTHESRNMEQISQNKIQEILQSFVGKQLQTPPMFSAKKVNGQKLYDLARKGIEIKRKPNEIEIYEIELLDFIPPPPLQVEGQSEVVHLPILKIKVTCSTGTYIRTLARDIGEKLGCGAYCEELIRTKIGEYSLDQAKTPEELSTT